MKNKIKNSLKFLAVAFLLLSGAFLLPVNDKASASGLEENISVENNSNSDILWSETLNNVSGYSLSLIEVNGQPAYKISNATELAYMAYMVNSGNSNYIGATYALTANIDLSGSLWTPIGTSENKFQGIFYGQGFDISNISINEYSCDSNKSSGAGLFGVCSNAIIGDVNLTGWQQINVDADRPIASLVANLQNSYVINCYDATNSKANAEGNSFDSVYNADTSSFIFRGGYRYDSSTQTYITYVSQSKISKTITVTNDNSEKGYVGTYSFKEGSFMRGDKVWHEEHYYKMLLLKTLKPTGFSVFCYGGIKPVLREDATDSTVYVLREGYKASIPDFSTSYFAKGLYCEISSTKTTVQITLDHNYGTRKANYTFGYDQSFASYFEENAYVKTRAGYDFEGIYSDISLTNKMDSETLFGSEEVNTNNNEKYKSCFPKVGEVYCFNWTEIGGNNLYVRFAIAGDEGGKVTTDAYSAVASYTEILTNVPAGNFSFEIKLNIGYQIGNIADEEGYPIKNTQPATGVSYTDKDFVADNVSGVYPNFSLHTGTGANYSTTVNGFNANNDDYAPVAGSAFVESGSPKEGTVYRIMVDNICGANGEIWIVLERQWIEVDFDFSVFEGVTYTWGILSQEKEGENLYKKEGDTLFARRGEKPQVFVSTKDSPIVAYVLNYPGSRSIHEFKDVGGEQDSSYTVNGKIYYKYMTFYITDKGTATLENDALYNEDGSKDKSVKIDIGPLQTMISLTFKDVSGKKIENIDGTLGAYINYEKKSGENILGNVDAKLVPVTGIDIIDVKSNGIYEAVYLSVDGKNVGNFKDGEEVNFRTLTLEPASLITPYINGTEGVNHQVVVYFDLRQYDLNFEFYFEGKKVDVNKGQTLNSIGLSGHEIITNITQNYLNQDANSTLNFEFTLSKIGQGSLIYDTFFVVNENGTAYGETEDIDGFVRSTAIEVQAPTDGSEKGQYQISLGTYETTLRVYFNLKQVNLEISSLHLDSSLILDAVNQGLMAKLTSQMKFVYSSQTGLTLSYLNDGDVLGNLTLHTKFYLLGWYLQNGEVVFNSGYQTFMNDSRVAEAVAKEGSQSADSVLFSGLSAEVGLRKVNVSYNAGSAGNGRLYNADKVNIVTGNVSAGSVTYGEKLTLRNDIFFNLGYSFLKWTASSGSVSGQEFSISGGSDAKSWSNLFDSSAVEMKVWASFVTNENDANVSKEVTLTAEWEIIKYYLQIDGEKQTFITIGDQLYYTTDDSKKNGQATYYISQANGISGAKLNGYYARGYKIEHGGLVTNMGANAVYTLSPDNFLLIIDEENKFAVNTTANPIVITTIREASDYLIYLENSTNEYYSYNWNENSDNGNFGQIQDGQISINVIFDTLPANLQNAIDSGVLIIERQGYEVAGWAISNSGVQVAVFDQTKVYSYARDQYIVPIWKKVENTTISTIEWTEDVGNIRTFYLEKEHDILQGSLSGLNVGQTTTVKLNQVLTNGEKIVDFGFIVNGATYSQKNILNYNLFKVAGNYQVKFYLTLTDTLNVLGSLSVDSYTTESATVSFNISKNELYFYDYNLHTIFTGTSEFVAGEENDFGSFLYRYDWNGNDLSRSEIKTEIGKTSEFFSNFVVTSQNKNVGSNKTLQLSLNKESFGSEDLTAKFANVSKSGEEYVVSINQLNIDKAQFEISFPQGSAYYIEGVQALVYDNSSNYTFSVGSTTFTYTYDKIFLHEGAKAGLYQGNANQELDKQNFIIESLEITGHEGELDTNFNWVVSKESKFTLLDPSSALKLDYQVQYLSASNGMLDSALSNQFALVRDTMSVTNIFIDGKAVTAPTGDQFTFSADNQVILYVAGNASERVYVYINKALLSAHSLSFNVVANVSAERKEILKPLAFLASNSQISTIEKKFDTFDCDWTQKITPTSVLTDQTNSLILTDVVKVNIDYNSGHLESGEESKTLYISSTSAVELEKPVHDYQGLAFDGFISLAPNSILNISSSFVASTACGGKTENVKAKWLLEDLQVTRHFEKVPMKASATGYDLALSNIASIILPEGITAESYALKTGTTYFNYTLSSKSFHLANEKGMLVPAMSGTYTLEISVTYSDGVGAPQNKTKTVDFEIEITINEIKLVHDNTNHLVYSNSRAEDKVEIEYYINDIKVDDITLAQIGKSASAKSDYPFYYTCEKELFNAGEYQVSFDIKPEFSDIWTINIQEITKIDEILQKTFIVNIDKYVINIVKYSQQIVPQLKKVFGSADPNPLVATVTVHENAEQIQLSYIRQSGEAIGQYSVRNFGIVYGDQASNYAVDEADAELYFEITKPGGNLKVEFLNKISYVYNGFAVTEYQLSYSEGKYILKAIVDGAVENDTLEAQLDIYFESGATRVEIPLDQRQAYTTKFIFTSPQQEKVGTYDIEVSLTAQAGEEWTGVDKIGDNGKVVVSKRNLTVKEIVKVFDGTNGLSFNNVDLSSNTCEITLENLVSGDQVSLTGRISSNFVGLQDIASLTLSSFGDGINYSLVLGENLKVKVVANDSQEIVADYVGKNNLEYGEISLSSSLEEINKLLPLEFNQGVINNQYISVSGYEISEGVYSSGKYLHTGNYLITFTLSSKNYTFGKAREESLEHIYTTEQQLSLVIDKKAITVTNTTDKIVKVYDGNDALKAVYIGQNVNNGGNYSSTGLLAGDVLTISKAKYVDRNIGTNKDIIDVEFEGDTQSYTISTALKGDIINVSLLFNKNGASQEFVDGVKEFANTSSIEVEYAGNIDSLIATILLSKNLMSRVGYTQTGYKYNGVSLAEMTATQKEEFLQSAVDGQENGITIDAIWQINKYTLSFTGENAQVLIGESQTQSIEVDYYTSFEKIDIAGSNGYKLNSLTLSNENGAEKVEVLSGLYSKNASFKVEHLLDNLEISVNMVEIEVKIIIEYNQPENFEVSTDNEGWIGIRERVMTYSQLALNDLPVLKVTTEKTYDFDFWSLNGQESQGLTIWQRINGDALTQDNLAGYTFVANWTESALTLTLDIDANINVGIKKGEETLVLNQNVVTIFYNDSLTFNIVANDWSKWSVLNVEGDATLSGDLTATNTKTGSFALEIIKSDLTVEIKSALIKTTFSTSYSTLAGATISENNGSITAEWTKGGEEKLSDILDTYTPSVGTYIQNKWIYANTDVSLDANIEELIIELNGEVPVQDITLSLKASFSGLVYKVTFTKGGEDGAVFVEDPTAETITKDYVYGSAMNNLPVIEKAGKEYIYKDQAGSTFREGQQFVSSCANEKLVLTLTADWAYVPYSVKLNLGTNADKVNSISYNGFVLTGFAEVIYGDSITFVFDLDEGYELNSQTTILSVGGEATTLQVSGNILVVENVQANTEVGVEIKAKDYTITITKHIYEEISKTEYDVSYDMDISNIFDGESFVRQGYTLSGLNQGEEKFASYSNGWTFEEQWTQDNKYRYDGNLTLTLEWAYDAEAKYIQATTSVASGLYYNATAQTIATSTFAVQNSQTFNIGATFANGDKVQEVYYLIGGTKVSAEKDLSLVWTDYISANVQIIAIIEDTHTGATHQIASSEKAVILNKTEVNIVGAVIESFYNESEVLNNTENTQLGEVFFHDLTLKNSELSIAKVEIIDQTGLYSVGENYQVKYFFTYNSLFKPENYSSLVKEGGYYTLSTQDMVSKVYGKIIPTQVTLEFEEMGYYNGEKQSVSSFSVLFPSFVTTFRAKINSITTVSAEIKKYTLADEFEIDGNILNANGIDRTSNFVFVIKGGYTILSTESAFKVEWSARYFNLSNLSLPTFDKLENESYLITSFNHAGKTVAVSEGTVNYITNGKLILTITNNGSEGQFAYVTAGESVTFNFALKEDAPALIGCASVLDASQTLTKLQTLESEGARSQSLTTTAQTTYYAVVTDYRAIKMSLGDKGGDQGFLYIKKGSSAVAQDPASWTGFVFSEWQSGATTSNVTITNGEVYVASSSKIVAGEIVAKWALVSPEATGKTFTFSANPVKGAMQNIAISDITTSGIENFNSQITYSYKFVKDGVVVGTNETLSVSAMTTSAGNYTLTITASFLNYQVQSGECEFELVVERISLSSMTLSAEKFTYANVDYISQISVTFEGGVEKTQPLSELISQETSTYYFTISGKASDQIRLVGEYTLTLNVDENIFDKDSFVDGFEWSANVVVEKASLEITQIDIPLAKASKLYLEDDPDFAITKMANGENVDIKLARQAGEDCGTYAFTSAVSDNENYLLSIKEGTIFTISQSNLTLKVRIDSKISVVYTKSAPDFVVAYNEGLGRWTISLGSSTSPLTLTYMKESEEVALTGLLYRHALARVDFIAPKAINVATYSGSDMQAYFNQGESGNFLAYEVSGEFAVTKKALEISKVEKVFDRSDAITISELKGIISGDVVSLSGKYTSLLAGEDIPLKELKLTGEQAPNYSISNLDFLGRITKAEVGEIEFTLTDTQYIYGQINKDSKVGEFTQAGYTFKNGEVVDDVVNGYISISSWTVESSLLSTSGHLIAGKVVVKFIFTSTNFAGLNAQGYAVELDITAKEINLASLNIVKEYDETALLPKNLSTSLAGYILDGDIASIDLTKGGYDNAQIGEGKKVTIVLTGADSANYSVRDNLTGTITAYLITFNVQSDLEHADLVTDGAFVKDNEETVVVEDSFRLYYPANISGAEMLAKLTYPARKGYTAVGWKYYDQENKQYLSINASNINEILKNIAEDKTNTTNSMNIFTVWEINQYDIVISGENVKEINLSATPENTLVGDSEKGYKIRYFSTLDMKVEAVRGYKIQSVEIVNGNVGASDRSQTGKNSGTFKFERVGSDLDLQIVTADINVVFNIEFNAPIYTSRTDNNKLNASWAYSALESLKEENLPQLTVVEGTYIFDGFVYGQENTYIAQSTLKYVVDSIYPNLESDVQIKLIATWAGIEYIVKFDENGGNLVGESQISAVYGKAMTEDFPTATLPGRSNTWKVGDVAYVQGDVLRSVGEQVDGKWVVTMVANWTNNPYTLTVKIDSKLQVYLNMLPVENNDTFTVVYNETQLSFTVASNTGYVFDIDKANLNGQATKTENSVVVCDLTADGELSFIALPDDNTLNIKTDKVSLVKAYIVKDSGNEEIEIIEEKLTAKTESQVQVVLTALKGWKFTQSSIVFEGNGSWSASISEDSKTLTLLWEDFVDDATFVVTGEADDNIITTGNLKGVFASLAFNGQAINLEGDTFTIKTDTPLNIVGGLVYGYKNASITALDGKVTTSSNTFSSVDRHYHFNAVVEEFDESFTLEFQCQAREFVFSLSVREGDETYGQIIADENQTVKFAQALKLEQQELVSTFMFDKWLFSQDKVLNFEGNGDLILSQEYFDMLESEEEGQTISLIATYKRKVTQITFSATGKGSYDVSQPAEGVEFTVTGGLSYDKNVYMSQYLQFTINPNAGYEVDKLLINGVEESFEVYGYDVESGEMAIFIELESSITSISISFKASKAIVYVQAGIRVNYQDFLGTNAGGNIYIADSTGALLGDELYGEGKNGNTLIGGDYSVETHTDATLFFSINVKSGYTMAISASAGVLINEYQGANGKVYSFANVKDGSSISVLFTAKENVVNVKFALEGQSDLANAGIIIADTSSNFVSAIPNRGHSLTINVITGEDLLLSVNSSLAYKLAVDDYGYVKYKIVYSSENQFEPSQINVGEVVPSDSIRTGWTNSASFKISNVTAGATIIFYVQPREYSVRYSLFDGVSLTMAEKVRYGESWSTDLLTADEKKTVFANRSGYTFLGYYTMPNGQGTQYIDRYGKVVRDWFEDGYTFNGSTYELEENFNNDTSTFTLYANWLYNRADVTIKFAPTAVLGSDNDFNISHVITNINSLSAWVSPENRWYAEIVIGATLQIKALQFEGYKFVNWIISFEGSEGIEKPANFNLSSIEMGSYVLKAIYKPTYELKVQNENNGLTNGGTVHALQNNQMLSDGSFDSQTYLSLKAVPSEGYKFLYFIDNKTGVRFDGQIDASGIATYTYPSLLDKPVSVTAVFTGKTIIVNLDTLEVQAHHQLVSVRINDREVDYSKAITAQVGDTIKVTITKARGYGFEINGAKFNYVVENGNYVFTHTFQLAELTVVDAMSYSIDISFLAPKEEIKFAFDIDLLDAVDIVEKGKSGELMFVDQDGNDHEVQLGNFYRVPYGNSMVLKIKANENYVLKRVYLYTTEMTYEITGKVVENELLINSELMDLYFDYEIKIQALFERLLWTDVRAQDFQGKGTRNSPYVISSAEEFALLAYLVNNGIKNADGELYAECHYAVTESIDFKGRYFEPIGTEENPFNGTIDLGKHEFKNVAHYREYTDPNTSFSGLFWHFGSKAKVIQAKGMLWLVILMIALAVVAVGVFVLVFLLIRKRKKKKLNELAVKS